MARTATVKTPLTRSVRKLVDGTEDMLDEALTRAEGAERDARRLVTNLIFGERERDEDKGEERETTTRRRKTAG